MDAVRPLPVPTPVSEPFWHGLANDQVIIQQCNDCQAWVFYPRSHCNHCLSPNLNWQEVSGLGKVYSFTIARRPTAPQFADELPQLIAVVELNEGVRMNCVLVNVEADEIFIGMDVKAVFHRINGATLLYFEPA